MRNRKDKNCLDLKYCTECSKKILLWTIAGNVFLAFIKLLGGSLSGSSGLFADGLQSVTCVIASIVIMYSLSLSQKKENEHFPYGYGKVEYIVALAVFSILLGLGLFISISSLLIMLKRDFAAPSILGLPVASISVLLTYMMYKYNMCAGKKLESNSITANAYQSKADLYSSSAVCLGILIAQISPSLAIFDRLAAFFVGLLIIKDSFHHWGMNLKVILDKVPEPEHEYRIRTILSEGLDGQKPDFIKIRRTGKKYWIGIGIDFDQDLTIAQIDSVTNKLKDKIISDIDWIGEVDFFQQDI